MTQTRMLAFDGARGGRLAGRLDVPDGTPRAVALIAHCFGGGNEGPTAEQFARCFTERGMAVLSVDCAAGGAAGGPPDGLALGADDLAGAAGRLGAVLAAPAVLVGHSLAGPAMLAVAGRVPEARAVATVGAPAGDAERIAALRRPLLIVHAPDDQFVSVDQARVIFEAARHPKSFVSLDGTDHWLTRPADAGYAAGVIAAWAARYLPAPADGDAVVVTESEARPFGQRITIGGHELTADEPAAVGGADTGPSPYGLLLAALGSCTAITVRMYANRKGWPLRHVTVQLRHGRIHARDCAECETSTGQLDHIERKIRFDGDLTTEQRARLLDMAGRCPVHRTLRSEVHVSTAEEGD